MDYVLEDNEFTQEELLNLIKQSKDDDNSFPIKNDINLAKNYSKLDMPSTSASGLVDDKSETDSSIDDDDFIDVTVTEDSPTSFPCGEISCNQRDKELSGSPTKGSNFDSIRNAKTNSLYLKIVQQKLDDIVVSTSSKNKSAINDTRKQSLYSISKNIDIEQTFKISESNPVTSIAISLDIGNEASVTKCDDLFADVFYDSIGKSKTTIKNKSTCKDIVNNGEHMLENVSCSLSDNSFSITSHPCTHELKEKDAVSNSTMSNVPPTLLTDQLKDKISELLEIELKKIISHASLGEHQADLQEKKEIEVKNGNDKSSINPIDNFDLLNSEGPFQNKNLEHLNVINDINQSLPIYGTMKDNEQEKPTIPNAKYVETSLFNSNKIVSQPGSDMSETSFEKQNSFSNVDDIDLLKSNSNNFNLVMKPLTYSENELKDIESQLEKENKSLITEAYSQDKVAAELSDQVYGDAQELLQLFGLPYLVAPMEAEAQCAFLDQIGLIQGTITDDSDIFLFGGQRVYKNFFNQTKHVEFFKLDNIKHNFGLDRDKLISLALLTGSDYTTGIESVGTILGMEILAEFPGDGIDCLKKLKKWWKSAQSNVSSIYTSKTKQRLSSLYLPESFPNENIFKAYLEPDVDESREKFSWVMPNVKCLMNFTSEKFGWSNSKSSEILVPVLEKLGLKETQLRIDSYFNKIKLVKGEVNNSKRLTEAIQKYKGEVDINQSVRYKKLSKDAKSIAMKDKCKAKNKRALLIDHGSLPTTSKSILSKKRKKRTKNEHLPRNAAVSTETLFCNEKKINTPLTKNERKKLIYQKLLEKEKVMQCEVDKKNMSEKKRLAVEIFQSQKK